jgi:holliday junction DNA helicase RuvA
MIASVSGEVLVRRPDHVVIDVAGVGYALAVSAETLRDVPPPGSRATLHSHLIVRDDALNLYGFATPEERELFLSLTSVSGVGPKVALAALSGGPVRELLIAIAASDAKRFQAVPGIGKRTAERIIVELREKVAGQLEGDGEGITVTRAGAEAPRSLAREGLMNLGYTPIEAERALDRAEGETPEELIQSALRSASGATAT